MNKGYEMSQNLAIEEQTALDKAEHDIGWYNATLDANTWWGLTNVEPHEAALLLCGVNPDHATPSDTCMDDYKSLLRIFKDMVETNPQRRTLSQWRTIASSKGMTYAPWIDIYRKARETVGCVTKIDTPLPVEIKSSYIPSNAVGNLAVMAAIEIEQETQKRASALLVMERLQQWADGGSQPSCLHESDKKNHAVIWTTSKQKRKGYTSDACAKTLEKWNKGRQ